MVDAGEIFAEIDASAGMVRFLEDPEQYTSPAALHHLDSVVQSAFTLAKKLQEVNTQVNVCRCPLQVFGAGMLRQQLCCVRLSESNLHANMPMPTMRI